MPIDFAAVAAPFRMQPGLRRIAAGTAQLTLNGADSPHLAAKRSVLCGHADQALLAAQGVDPRPWLRAVMAQAVADHPSAFDWDGADRFAARRLGWSVRGAEVRGDGAEALGTCLRALPPPLRAAGLLCLAFEEDFAGIDGATSRMPWLAVCLPSHWAPEAKIGRSFAEVHAPVADNATLISAGDSLMRLVTAGDRWERFVWTVTPRATLDAHPSRTPPAPWPVGADPDALAAAAFFRTEHQTFIPLPALSRQAVFTIRVAVTPLAMAIDDDPSRAQRLHAALASMSDAVLAYRDLGTARDRLLAWLERRTAA